ncbi:unnamed protein product [Dovyalis caffra]|uniref:PGG domain-containing protein n=1 Tax=Dovyalis caffra TaxID=77055 RepID=A0AAV1SB72_9ROSI|nr:unnamed protein product [Dovyalis caffra]
MSKQPEENASSSSKESKFKAFFKDVITPRKPPCQEELNSDMRNVMLVGAALIATVTFQAGITPPGGVWQSDDILGHRAGHAVYSDQKIPFQIFLICNTIALTSSIFILLCLTFRYPYFLEVLIASISMMGTYSSGIYCITPYESVSFRLIFVAAPAPAIIRFVIWVVASAFRHRRKSVSWFKKFQYDKKRDSPSEARNVLLVVVALIAAVTFQAGVNPPGGVWQDGDHAGRAIYASQKRAYYVFLLSNTLALSACILVITSLTYKFPLHFEIWVATASMMITYASAVFAVTPHESVHFRYLLLAASVPFVIRLLSYLFKKYCRSEKESQIGSQADGEKKDQKDGQAGQQV